MAHIAITSPESKLCKVVFKEMPLESANSIAQRLNELNALAAKTSAKGIKLVYKVIGK